MAEDGKVNGLRFKDKVAVITGGCSGIGRACADIFAENGGKIAVLDINDKVGQELSSQTVAGEYFYIHCDLKNEQEIKDAVEQVAKRYGRIDCLINNVGAYGGFQLIDDVTVEGFKDLLNLNLVSYFTASKYSLPHLRKVKGTIVNIASMAASAAMAGGVSYTASKGGVVSLTKALAIDEAKNGVRVNCVSPGPMDTPLFQVYHRNVDKVIKKIESTMLLKRIGQPREIGMAVLFLAVDATFSTGVDLLCSGGSEIGFGVKD